MRFNVKSQTEKVNEFAKAYSSTTKQRIAGFTAFSQLRIGYSQDLGCVSILAILPESLVERLEDFRSIAREIESKYLEKGFSFSILTMATDAPDQDLINCDFPVLVDCEVYEKIELSLMPSEDIVKEILRRQNQARMDQILAKNDELRQEIIERVESLDDGLAELLSVVKKQIARKKKRKN